MSSLTIDELKTRVGTLALQNGTLTVDGSAGTGVFSNGSSPTNLAVQGNAANTQNAPPPNPLPTPTTVLSGVTIGSFHDYGIIAATTTTPALLGCNIKIVGSTITNLTYPTRQHAIRLTVGFDYATPPNFIKDIMAPAAAHIATGVPLSEFGDAVDVHSLSPGLVPLPQERDDGVIVGEVLWVDRYGNCQLNVSPDMLSDRVGAGGAVEVRLGSTARRARWVHTFADAKPSELVLIVDSYGMFALALDRATAAAELGLRAGRSIAVAAPGTGDTDVTDLS